MDSVTTLSQQSLSLSEAFEVAAVTAFSPINQSWLPVKAVQCYIDLIHLATGLPWWLSIVAATIAVRLALLPLFVQSQRNSARMQLARPELTELGDDLKRRMDSPAAAGSSQAARQAQLDAKMQQRQRVLAVFRKYQCSPAKFVVLPLVSLPVFISFFAALRCMHDLYPSYTAGGFGFMLDLSAADPTLLLPVLNTGLMLLQVELTTNDLYSTLPPGDRKKLRLFFRVAAIAILYVGRSFSAGLFVYWITTSLFTLLQQLVFRSAAGKRLLGIPDVSHLVVVRQRSPLLAWFDRFEQQQTPETQPPPPASVKEAVVQRNEKLGAKAGQQSVQMFTREQQLQHRRPLQSRKRREANASRT